MPFQPFANRYSPHADLTLNPSTGVVSITVAHHPENRGANCRVYELAPPYTGQPVLKREYKQGEPGQIGPFGHGASLVLPTGALLVAVPLGIESAANVPPTILIEPGYAAPYQLGGDALAQANAAEIHRLQEIASMQQQRIVAIETALANVAQGGLSAEDAALLAWLRTMPR